jgi:translation initiation factor 2 beta subunit (eIF-2beta)/eIF-5
LKRKKAEKESFAEIVLLLRKLLVGELMTNASIDGNVELLLRGQS